MPIPLSAEPEGYPRVSDQQAEIAVGSPLAIVALFTEIVRQRFRLTDNQTESGLPWYWEENPTPQIGERNDPDSPTQIMIESAYNDNPEARNFRPSIWIDKGETAMGKVAINHMAGKQIRSGITGFYGLAQIPMDIEVLSDAKGESATMADIVWFYLLAGREQIRKTFGIRDFGEPTLGRTVPGEADKQVWSTHINFTIQIELRWLTMPIAPLLKDLVLRFRQSGETNPDTFLLKQYIR